LTKKEKSIKKNLPDKLCASVLAWLSEAYLQKHWTHWT